jgi:ubiquinone/menaquinone biosynthesis C-methylase UbiE
MTTDTYKQWDSSASWYDQNMGETGDQLNHQIIKPKLMEVLGDLSRRVILDSGCGSGYLAAELAQTAKQVVGIDFSEKFIELCKTKYIASKNLSFQTADVSKKLPFESSTFNTIISKMVLQYVPKINIFASEAYRVSKHKGELIIIVDHPFHTQYFYAQQEAGKPNPKYPKLNNYYSNQEQSKLSLWGKVELTWYPKTVSQYVLVFVDVGWKLTDIQELSETKEDSTLPRILMLKFLKE